MMMMMPTIHVFLPTVILPNRRRPGNSHLVLPVVFFLGSWGLGHWAGMPLIH